MATEATTDAAGTRYPLNLPVRADAEATVTARARTVDQDLPPDGTGEGALAQAMLALAGPASALVEPLAARLLEGDVGLAFDSAAGDERPAFHELTAGLIDLPFARFTERFDPARDWGRRLARHRGGELAVDRTDGQGRALAQRERMVVAMPWYAVGGPDMDMSKYEVVERSARATTVLWWVAHSENRSVFRDDGYLVFKAVEAGGRERTLVFFNSIHSIDPGWGGAMLPAGIRDAVTRRALRETFLAHVASYRAAVTGPTR